MQVSVWFRLLRLTINQQFSWQIFRVKGSENANPIPVKEIRVTFHNAKQNSFVRFIPFLGQEQEIKGVWQNKNLTVTLPEITRGAIFSSDKKSFRWICLIILLVENNKVLLSDKRWSDKKIETKSTDYSKFSFVFYCNIATVIIVLSRTLLY